MSVLIVSPVHFRLLLWRNWSVHQRARRKEDMHSNIKARLSMSESPFWESHLEMARFSERSLPYSYDSPFHRWDQSLEEVNIWIKPPPGVTTQHLDIKVTVYTLKFYFCRNLILGLTYVSFIPMFLLCYRSLTCIYGWASRAIHLFLTKILVVKSC